MGWLEHGGVTVPVALYNDRKRDACATMRINLTQYRSALRFAQFNMKTTLGTKQRRIIHAHEGPNIDYADGSVRWINRSMRVQGLDSDPDIWSNTSLDGPHASFCQVMKDNY